MKVSKSCTRCGVTRPLSEYHNSKSSKDGRQSWCKVCQRGMPRSKRNDLPGYACWLQMNIRCAYVNGESYPHYGGRGITVCPEWRGRYGYERFIAHIGPRPSPKHQVDRIDNDGNYEPGNVRWVLPVVNIRNRRNTVHLTCNGETKPLGEWAEQVGVPPYIIRGRIKKGWSHEQAVFGKKARMNTNQPIETT